MFVAVVLVLGTVPPGAIVVDFRSALEGTSADINPDLLCVKSTDGGTTVHCHLTESRGVARVEVHNGGRTVAADDSPPYEFSVDVADLETVVGERRITVVLLGEDGSTVRRYTRRVSTIRTG